MYVGLQVCQVESFPGAQDQGGNIIRAKFQQGPTAPGFMALMSAYQRASCQRRVNELNAVAMPAELMALVRVSSSNAMVPGPDRRGQGSVR